MQHVFVGRQPIFNSSLGVFAYELLFRSGEDNSAGMMNDNSEATSQTIFNSFLEIGLEKMVGNSFASINVDQEYLLNDNLLPVSPKNIILEISNIKILDDRFINIIQKLQKANYLIAVEDDVATSEMRRLVNHIDYVKIDVQKKTKKELFNSVKKLKKYDLKTIASKVETAHEYTTCLDLGFDYVQGYFLSQPRIVKGVAIPPNKLAVLHFLALINNEETELQDLSQAISSDVLMSYKLLKLINSAYFNMSTKVQSISQAIVMLGRNKLSSWASIMALSKLDGRPVEVIQIAMIRAKMCELLAQKMQMPNSEQYFTAGMFSSLELLLEMPLADILSELPLKDEINAALLHAEGPMGQAIECVKAAEVANWEDADFLSLERNEVELSCIEAIRWASTIGRLIQEYKYN